MAIGKFASHWRQLKFVSKVVVRDGALMDSSMVRLIQTKFLSVANEMLFHQLYDLYDLHH